MAKWTEERRQAASQAAKERLAATFAQNNPPQPPKEVEEEPVEKVGSLGFLMSHQDKLQSMLNAIKILPPNLIKDGRHTIENVQALNCFKVTEKMMDEVYKDFSHGD